MGNGSHRSSVGKGARISAIRMLAAVGVCVFGGTLLAVSVLRERASDVAAQVAEPLSATPIVSSIPPSAKKESANPVVLTFVGDLMFDRYVRERAAVYGYDRILRDALPLFASSTILVGNLEGPVSTHAPVSDYRDPGPDHYRFTFATTVARTLRDAGFSAVSLSNNHIRNFGADGVVQTRQWLAAAGVDFVGSVGERADPWRVATSGVSLALYAYDPWSAQDGGEALPRFLAAEASSTFVVVYAHWGEEYEPLPSASQRALAHRFVDAGADLVVGAHPHVVQRKERYRDAWVYYSLGNFVFDQYFSPEVRCGAVVSFTVVPRGVVDVREAFSELRRDGTVATSTCLSEVPLL